MHPNQTAEEDLKKILQAQYAKMEDEEQGMEVEVEGSSHVETAAKEDAGENMIREIVVEDMKGEGVEGNRAELIADSAPYQAQPQLRHSRPRMRVQQRGQHPHALQHRGQQHAETNALQHRGQQSIVQRLLCHSLVQRLLSHSAAPHSIRVASAAHLFLHAVAAHLPLDTTACGASGDRACFQSARARALSLSLGDGGCLQPALAAAASAATPTPLPECLPRARRSLLSA